MLKDKITELYNNQSLINEQLFKEIYTELIEKLNHGEIRAAEKDENNEWQPNIWIKQGILLVLKYGSLSDMSIDGHFKYYDKNTVPLKPVSIDNKIRLVPGGSSIRTGAYVAKGVICMPPMYINIGSYVDEESMIDSHALVGTCAQIGKRVHLSAASQIGGVLEPPGARPVIVEDDVLIGGNCGVYEGILIRKRAVLGSGVILTSSTKVYDLVKGEILKSSPGKPLEIPESAVVVPGSRAVSGEFAEAHKLSISTPLIIKYRDDKTDAKTALEDSLR